MNFALIFLDKHIEIMHMCINIVLKIEKSSLFYGTHHVIIYLSSFNMFMYMFVRTHIDKNSEQSYNLRNSCFWVHT